MEGLEYEGSEYEGSEYEGLEYDLISGQLGMPVSVHCNAFSLL